MFLLAALSYLVKMGGHINLTNKPTDKIISCRWGPSKVLYSSAIAEFLSILSFASGRVD